ncbi:hypothetical protein [Agreia pratensis]|uniref:Uncharacterized protein n=1 Tax=Agreia pratensis TaxID=150121 RepID=A0A1X7L8W0_9MICO|nr:hypothetical protein [Agreia pratensis]SMG49934.1 hypothetical protein SAMN06296010_3455 [Agreia pratensis]
MSRSTVLRQFAAGVFLVNAVPHGIAGVQGRRFPSPFARPPGRGLSSPTVNVVWSALNAAAGAAFLRRNRTTGESVAVGVGAATMAIFLSLYFEKSEKG